MHRVPISLAAFAVGLAAYAVLFRPSMLRWGATRDEVDAAFPGAGLIPGGTRGATMATTIDAPPDKVWPWLVQMGYGRAGWYSWDWLDNVGRKSSDRLHREWQTVEVGDYLAGPNVSKLEREAWRVAALDPERFLGLESRIPNSHSLWGFLLKKRPDGKTRLIVSGYWAMTPRWLQPAASFALLEWTHWIMQTRQFANLKMRVAHKSEREHSRQAPFAAPRTGYLRASTVASTAGFRYL